MIPRHLKEINERVEAEGYEPGTPAFSQRVLVLKISKCQELRNIMSCSVCSWREECQMVREFAQLRLTNE